MPTKGKLPTAREMEGQVLAALKEWEEEIHYSVLDETIHKNLEPWVYSKQFKEEILGFFKTSFSNKCSAARRSLRKQGLIERGRKQGHWRIVGKNQRLSPEVEAKIAASVDRLAQQANVQQKALAILREGDVPETLIEDFLKVLAQLRVSGNVTVTPSDTSFNNSSVEQAAIQSIRKKQTAWHNANDEIPNNPGFDLYQTESGESGLWTEMITAWCEVKSLSGRFGRVHLSKREFEEAQEHGKNYWHYIVENVKEGNANIIPINDPAGKAQQFSYGSEWRPVAEKSS